MLKLTKPLAFIDLETTGINLGSDRIVEIAIVKILADGSRSVKRKLINPQMPIPKQSTDVHGITDDMVKDAPAFKEVAQELKQMLDGCDIGGYNSNRFDIPLLMEEFIRAEVEFDMKGRKLVDVQNIFHKMEQRTLSAAYKFYCNKNLEGAHGAEVDASATHEILEAKIIKYVIMDLSTTIEGDTTNFYIYKRLKPFNIAVSTIARGIAIGDELEYADEVTLGRSIINRTLYENSLTLK